MNFTIDTETINLLFDAILTVLGILVLKVLVPWIKSKIGDNNYKLLIEAIEIGIRYAEQNFPEYASQEKKAEVLKMVVLEAQKIGIDKTEEELSRMIDAFVNKIKYSDNYTKNKE